MTSRDVSGAQTGAPDLRSERYVPIDLERLFASQTWADLPASEAKAMFALWLHSWHEVPAGSLPADDPALAVLAGVDLALWPAWKPLVLRHWFTGDDGRLYHPVITTLAGMVAEKRRRQREEESTAGDKRLDVSQHRGDHGKTARPGKVWDRKARALSALARLGRQDE